MLDKRLALLIQSKPESLDVLKPFLKDLGIATCTVATLAEAKHLLQETEPQLVFTDRDLPDGSFAQVLEMTEKLDVPANVIVVGTQGNLEHNNATITRGAFDFLEPPFDPRTLDDVVSAAVEDALMRRRQRVGLMVRT